MTCGPGLSLVLSPPAPRLEPYGEEELAEIVARAAGGLGSPVTFEAARDVAARSRGTPREAIQLLERARDISQVSEMAQVSEAPQERGMSQADGDPGAVLVPEDQEYSLSPYVAKCGNVKIVLMSKKSGETYGNGEVAAKAQPPARPSVRRAHVVHGDHVKEAAQRAGLDERGLSREDRAVVRLLLERDAPMGLEAIASRPGRAEKQRARREPRASRSGRPERRPPDDPGPAAPVSVRVRSPRRAAAPREKRPDLFAGGVRQVTSARSWRGKARRRERA